MKKIIFNFIIGTVVLATATSCNRDNEDERSSGENENEKVEIVIHSGVSTKAVDTQWEAGDAIGVNVYNPDTTVIIDGQFNRMYVTQTNGENGIFNAPSTVNPLYFPQDGSNIRLKAYYPYRATLGNDMLYTVNVTNQARLQDIDLMTAVHMTGFSKNDTDVWLHFYHRLSKLIFVLSTGNEVTNTDLSSYELTIRGMQGGNTYDLFVNDFLTRQTGLAPIEVPRRNGEVVSQRQAIVLPREAGTGVYFDFTSGSETYTAQMPTDLELESGYQYIFYITLSRNFITNIRVDIEEWKSNDPINIIAQ